MLTITITTNAIAAKKYSCTKINTDTKIAIIFLYFVYKNKNWLF